jgi:hypothetical protein
MIRPPIKPMRRRPPPPPQGWEHDEVRSGGALAELRRLFQRATARPWRTLLVALALTGAVVGYRARKQRVYESKIVFRVVEGDLDLTTSPRTNGRLREYVADVCFSNSRLASVIRARGLYPGLGKRDMSLALEEMRDDLEVEVWRNYFIEGPRGPGDAREAHVAISYRGRNARDVYTVVRDLGNLIIDESERVREGQANAALQAADQEVIDAKMRLETVQRDLVAKEFLRTRGSVTGDQRARLLVQTLGLQEQSLKLERTLEASQRQRQALYLRAQLEKKQLGLRFDLVDPGRVAPAGISQKKLLAIIAVVIFILSLPIAAMAVGAFDDRIYVPSDVARLGLRALGGVHGFDGDNVGALDERLRAEKRARATIGPP